MTQQPTDDGTRKVTQILGDQRTGMLTTTAPDGTLVSRPMALQEVEFDGDLWFFAERSSRKVEHVSARPVVNVGAGGGATWVSLTGRAEVVDDLGRKRDLWNPVVEAWFPDGPEDPGVVLLRVRADSAEYWDSAAGRLASLVSFAKAKVTGERYDGGENERVEL
ncbi:pyridoxamine 5'-phosphate oxidase family protein [Actinotalea sp. AC32]|nr:pyridoxamine 5'-phosphate oxidase family protein [Actinotalea sp. AC32]